MLRSIQDKMELCGIPKAKGPSSSPPATFSATWCLDMTGTSAKQWLPIPAQVGGPEECHDQWHQKLLSGPGDSTKSHFPCPSVSTSHPPGWPGLFHSHNQAFRGVNTAFHISSGMCVTSQLKTWQICICVSDHWPCRNYFLMPFLIFATN